MSVKNILFFYEDIDRFSITEKSIKNQINNLINNELKLVGDLSVIFCSDKYLLEINKQYLNHNYFTDIITFDYVEENVISGDLFISIERISENAKQFDTVFVKELYRVIFHGVLHLVGYNDKTDKEKMEMRGKENFYLGKINFSEEKL